MAEPRVALLVRVPANLKSRLAEIAKHERRSLSKQVELLLEKCLELQGREEDRHAREGHSSTGELTISAFR